MSVAKKTTIRNRAPSHLRSQGIAIHALHKSGTMFLYHFFKRLAAQQQFEFFSTNNDPPNEPAEDTTLPARFCCCPLRTFEFDSSFTISDDLFRIFHVRDPRDMLVSEYFSFGWSHPTTASEGAGLSKRRKEIQQMSIDDYVVNQPKFSNRPLDKKFRPLVTRKLEPNSEILVKYETMVTRFPAWVAKVIQPFGFRIPRFAAAKLAWRYRNEFKPSGKGTHKRTITPGDFRNQLQPRTIQILNDRFEDVLEKFAYKA